MNTFYEELSKIIEEVYDIGDGEPSEKNHYDNCDDVIDLIQRRLPKEKSIDVTKKESYPLEYTKGYNDALKDVYFNLFQFREF
jgi:hypothetical protein